MPGGIAKSRYFWPSAGLGALLLIGLAALAHDHYFVPRHPDLVIAIAKGDLADVKRFVRRDPRVVHQTLDGGGLVSGPPLFQACYWGDAAIAAYLLSEGADANQPGERGDTALHAAGFMGRGDIAELLLAHGAKVDATNNNGGQPLHECASAEGPLGGPIVMLGNEQSRIAEALLARGADPDARDHRDRTPLHIAADNGDAGIAAILLNRGATVDLRDGQGLTALHGAARRGHVELTRLLIAEGFDVNAPHSSDGRTQTPLDMVLAVQKKSVSPEYYEPVIALLRAHGGKAWEELQTGQ